MVRFVLCLLASASATTVLPRSGATPLLALRGGAYPPPKAGYHALAAKGAGACKQTVMPNLLSGALAGGYVAFGGILSLTVASALGDVSPGVQKLVFGLLFPIALLNIVATGSHSPNPNPYPNPNPNPDPLLNIVATGSQLFTSPNPNPKTTP